MRDALVETRYGQVRGTNRGAVSVWKGIPFARPPVGELRFRAPQPPAAWSHVHDATAFGTIAPQATLQGNGFLGARRLTQEPASEDCLYLNIWSPVPQGDGKKRPVLVWMHGGAFTMGSGSTASYDGANFAMHGDVVVVTLNYRLGALGFLYLGELAGERYVTSGNNGLLDQIAALQWVRDNIEAFGGDPDAVTVFGESAGAMSIGALLAMPASKGLFVRAILQSGAAHSVRSKETASVITREFLQALNLSENEMASLLQTPVDDLLAAQAAVVSKHNTLAFAPVVDGVSLPLAPNAAIASGVAKDVAVLIGTNRDEMKLFRAGVSATVPDESVLKRTFGVAADKAIATYTSARPGLPLSDVWTGVLTDQVFRIPAIRLAEKQAQQGAPVWMYRFDWATPAFGGLFGGCHALEIPFVWDNLETAGLAMLIQDFAGRQQLANRMHFAWIAFARTGNPNTPELPNWPTYSTDHRATMLFDEECRMVDDPQSEERRLWKGLL